MQGEAFVLIARPLGFLFKLIFYYYYLRHCKFVRLVSNCLILFEYILAGLRNVCLLAGLRNVCLLAGLRNVCLLAGLRNVCPLAWRRVG